MISLSDGWKRLREAVFSSEAVEITSESTKALLELAKTFKEEGAKLDILKSLAESSSLLDFLCSPSIQLLGTALPFIPVAITLLKIYREKNHQQLTLVECIAIAIQTAYVTSFKEVLSEQESLQIRWNQNSDIKIIKQEIKKLETFELDNEAAQIAITSFPDSQLAQTFNQVFSNLLQQQQIGLTAKEASEFTIRVTKNLERHLFIFIAEADTSIEALKEITSGKGIKIFEKYVSINRYIETEITPKPREKVFDENFSFEDIYVKPKARKVDSNNNVEEDKKPFDLENWAIKLLLDKDPDNQANVMFIQGGPGRGKSLFCRMFANLVQRDIYHRWIPILIRLRDIDEFQFSLEQTLSLKIKYDFAQNNSWLNDPNAKFLFILDGFDELRIEQKNNQNVDRFIRQVGTFGSEYKGRHRVIITGRAMALYGIDRLPSNLERVEIAEMDDELQSQWFGKWRNLFLTDKTTEFQQFLQDKTSCPEQVQELAKEPLLLYMLTAMHRDDDLDIRKFEQANGAEARISVYQQALDWVLTKQRSDKRHPDLNTELTGQDSNALRRILTEAAVCVVQSGGESASMEMVKARLQQDDGARELIARAEKKLGEEALKTALGAFYLKSSSGGVEFFHKSFREFLCAERLKEKLEDWIEPGKRGKKYNLDDKQLYRELYDFLGYGGLTPEIVEYLMGLLTKIQDFQYTNLFQRLETFYHQWCDGEFIDSIEETLPQKKARELQKHSIQLGQRQVDIFTGLNTMILLLELHRYAQQRDDLKQEICFYPSGKLAVDSSVLALTTRLFRVVNYSNSVGIDSFHTVIGQFLSGAHLSGAHLSGANLSRANLSRADLSRADLSRAYLSGANLSRADLSRAYLSPAHLSRTDLSGAHLSGANLSGADLSGADLSRANLSGANLSRANLSRTDLSGADLSDADLSRADLSGADLSGADLESADLSGTDLSRADLESADLSGTDLSRADLESAKNLIPEQVKKAKNWEKANYDEEFRLQLGLPPESSQ